jgi:hypothetical protein
VVTYIQPHLIPHLIFRGGIGLVALARRTFPWRCQPQLLVPTRRFPEVSGARRRSVAKLRKLRWAETGMKARHGPISVSALSMTCALVGTSHPVVPIGRAVTNLNLAALLAAAQKTLLSAHPVCAPGLPVLGQRARRQQAARDYAAKIPVPGQRACRSAQSPSLR